MAIKKIYLTKRNQATTHEEFRENWRGHTRLGRTFPNLLSYFDAIRQCAVLSSGTAADGSSEYDGVNLLTMGSIVEAVRVLSDPALNSMLEDELPVFAGPVKYVTLVAEETVLFGGSTTDVVFLRFIRTKEPMEITDFIQSWSVEYGSLITQLSCYSQAIKRYVHNHTIFPTPDGFKWDGVEEMWFEDHESARVFVTDPGYQELSSAERDWLAPPQTSLLCEINSSWIRGVDTLGGPDSGKRSSQQGLR